MNVKLLQEGSRQTIQHSTHDPCQALNVDSPSYLSLDNSTYTVLCKFEVRTTCAVELLVPPLYIIQQTESEASKIL